jgi:hypothetical protein
MPKLLEGHARPVTQNIVASGLWEFLYRGLPSLVTLFGGYKAISQGWTAPWVIGLGALVFLSLSIALHLLAVFFRKPSAVEKLSSAEGEKRTSTVPLARQPDTSHEDCQRQIRTLESTIARLQRNDQTQGIQISARDGQIEQLQAKLNELKTCAYESVHRVADHQATHISDFVTVSRVGVWEHKLDEPVPAIKWGFKIKNKSIFPIRLVGVSNNISFEKTELAEKRFDYLNEAEYIEYWREGSITFEQRLSGTEAQYIKNTPEGKFRFNRLIIRVGNPNSFPVIEPQELMIGDDLETTLNKVTYKETEGMVSLRKERDCLKGELEKAKGADLKLTFEIDERQTQVHTTGGGTAGRRITASVRLRCMKIAEYPMAIREFHVSLLKQDEPEPIVPREGALVVLDHPSMKDIDFANGWTINDPLTGYRWFMFYLDITETQLQMLSRDYFMRITMIAIGQPPVSIDFDVNNWQDARGSNSDITVRGKAA